MVTSTANKNVKKVLDLQTKAKARKKYDSFVIEGVRECQEAPINRIEIIYISETFEKTFVSDKKFLEIKNILDKVNYEVVSDMVFSHMSQTKTPQGILGIIKKNEYTLEDIINVKSCEHINDAKSSERVNNRKHFIFLENLQDPGNLGTILRTAEGAGVSGVIMSKDTVDIYNPKVVRSTKGTIFRVPFVYVEDIIDTVKKVKDMGVCIYAAHLLGENYYYNEDFTKDIGFIIGNEGNGITDELAKEASKYIKIPMCGKVESLNAANAATILMYEALRQRNTNI